MKRGAIVVVAAKGVYAGKPRPALVVQSIGECDAAELQAVGDGLRRWLALD